MNRRASSSVQIGLEHLHSLAILDVGTVAWDARLITVNDDATYLCIRVECSHDCLLTAKFLDNDSRADHAFARASIFSIVLFVVVVKVGDLPARVLEDRVHLP